MAAEKVIPKRFISYHVEFYGKTGLLDGLSMTIPIECDRDRLAYAFRRADNDTLDKTLRVKFYEYGQIAV